MAGDADMQPAESEISLSGLADLMDSGDEAEEQEEAEQESG